MKNLWGIFIILAVLVGMFCIYNSLNQQEKVSSPEDIEALQTGNANESLSAVKDSPEQSLDLDSLNDLEEELTPLEELQETL
jgi:hypothetical protein